MRRFNFTKMHGQGNDFIIVDSTINDISIEPAGIAALCDRHFGIGADGLIIVKKSENADFFMDYYNNDGSSAEMCGNGIRCMAAFIIDSNLSRSDILNIETRAGVKKIEINFTGNSGINASGKPCAKAFSGGKTISAIKVNMGRPSFEPEEIPVNMGTFQAGKTVKIVNYPLNSGEIHFNVNAVSMGNPHCVIFLDEKYDLDKIPIQLWGPAFETNGFFPKKANVEFVKITGNDSMEMRVWERGAGETLACGTGACASAACAIDQGRIKEGKVNVKLPGGALVIYWDKKSDIFLEGSASFVFTGTIYI